MSDDVGIQSAVSLLPDTIQRYDLEPKNSLYGAVQNFLQFIVGSGSSLLASGLGEIRPEFAQMIQEQIYWQYQMQMVSLISNVEKSKHECQMIPLRNVSLR